jgi:hypothetical protein
MQKRQYAITLSYCKKKNKTTKASFSTSRYKLVVAEFSNVVYNYINSNTNQIKFTVILSYEYGNQHNFNSVAEV